MIIDNYLYIEIKDLLEISSFQIGVCLLLKLEVL